MSQKSRVQSNYNFIKTNKKYKFARKYTFYSSIGKSYIGSTITYVRHIPPRLNVSKSLTDDKYVTVPLGDWLEKKNLPAIIIKKFKIRRKNLTEKFIEKNRRKN